MIVIIFASSITHENYNKLLEQKTVTIKEVQIQDIPLIVDYWQSKTVAQLNAMGIDESELHTLDNLGSYIENQLDLSYSKKSALYVGFIDNKPVGHCYVNGIEFGKEANMHL